MKKIIYIPLLISLALPNLALSNQCLQVYDYYSYVDNLTLAKAKDLYKFNLDESNFAYFKMLLKIFYAKQTNNKEIKLFDALNPNMDTQKQIVYLVANAPKELLENINLTNYDALLKDKDALSKLAKEVELNLNFMQAGTGTSVDRVTYLSELLNIPVAKVKNGAKATDLYLPGSTTSIAEALIYQGIQKSIDFGKINHIDLVSNETEISINSAWKNISQSKVDLKKLKRGNKVTQHHIPTIDPLQRISTKRLAPGGHGFFAFDVIQRLLNKSEAQAKNQITAISNGEDISGSPDPLIVGHMRKHNIPIMMVTTEKTEIDLKGGQIGIAEGVNSEGKTYFYPTIVEHAQADTAGQKTLFEQMGLKIKGQNIGERKSLFNTNMVIINEEALRPLLKAEVDRIGLKKLLEDISPALIRNAKKQVDTDGVERTYTQLEGAMGSIMLKLDQHFRGNHNTPLITFMNIERNHRTKFFAPIKTAFDYWMLFYSDRFAFDNTKKRLIDNRPGFLPSVKFSDAESKDKHYANVKNILESFKDTKIIELDELTISGKVNLSGLTLKGKVEIVNQSKQNVDVKTLLEASTASLTLENIKILITPEGQLIKESK